MKHTRTPHEWVADTNSRWQVNDPSDKEKKDTTLPVVYLGSLYQIDGWHIPLIKPQRRYLENKDFFLVTKIKVVHARDNVLNDTLISIRAFSGEREIEFCVSALVWKRYIKKVV